MYIAKVVFLGWVRKSGQVHMYLTGLLASQLCAPILVATIALQYRCMVLNTEVAL